MKFVPMTSELYDYLVRHGHNADPILAELAKETESLGPIAMMQMRLARADSPDELAWVTERPLSDPPRHVPGRPLVPLSPRQHR